MPKRKGRRKRGGAVSNPNNIHDSARFGSTKGLSTGCAGCVGGNVQIGPGCSSGSKSNMQESANVGIKSLMDGIKGNISRIMSGGGNAAETTLEDLKDAAQNNMGYGISPITAVQHCGVSNSTAMGAGQTGGSKCVNAANNLRPAGYGLNVPPTNNLNQTIMGSGYPVVSSYNTTKCGGRKRNRTKKRRTKKRNKKRNKKRGTKKRKKHNKKRKTKRRQRGGYHQYSSNSPNTPGFSSPNVSKMPWATGPLSIKRQVNCNENYNHYLNTNTPTDVFDGDIPNTHFGA